MAMIGNPKIVTSYCWLTTCYTLLKATFLPQAENNCDHHSLEKGNHSHICLQIASFFSGELAYLAYVIVSIVLLSNDALSNTTYLSKFLTHRPKQLCDLPYARSNQFDVHD